MEEKLKEIKGALQAEIEELSHLKSLDENTKQLARALGEAKKEINSDFYTWQKQRFELFLDAMILKIHQKYNKGGWPTNKTPKAEKQLSQLQEMKDIMERMTERTCIGHFQARIITIQERQIAQLQLDKQEIIDELETLKENIGDE